MIKPKVIENKVVFGPVRLSYTHLFQKYQTPGSNDEGKFMTSVLVPKGEKETVAAIEKAIEAAKKAGIVSKWQGKDPKKLQMPLRDGDEKDDETYAGHFFVNAKCKTRPGVVDRNRQPIMDEEEVYSGMWAIVSVSFFPYASSGNNGIGCGLNNVMKWKDDDRLGGRVSADSDFGDIDTEEDEDL